MTRDVEWDTRRGKAILIHLLPSAAEYLGKEGMANGGRLQGIGHRRYWLRIINEEIYPDQALDQTVLQDIVNWKMSPTTTSPLIVGLCAGGDYVKVWEHLALNCSATPQVSCWDSRRNS